MKTLKEYKEASGKSFSDIQKELKVFRCRTTIFQAIQNPWRTKWSTFLLLAKFLGMPEKDALKQWKASKREFNIKKYS